MSFDFSILITNRTAQDIQALLDLYNSGQWTAEQIAAFNLAANRGAYNYTDLNRVTACMEYLDSVLSGLGYSTGYEKIIVHPETPPVQDANTLLLLDGESLTDIGPYSVPITNNGVEVSGAQSKFGEKSLYFNGSSFLTTPSWNLGTADFTIDWWEYVTGGGFPTRFHTQYNAATGFLVTWSDGNSYAGSGASGWNVFAGVKLIDTVLNQWVHRAIVKSGNTWSSYKNGVLFWSGSSNESPYYSQDGKSSVGAYMESDPNFFAGYIDEFRVSDIARWTSDFTPPTAPYGDASNALDPYTWYESDIPTPAQTTQYLLNVSNLCAVFIENPQLPSDMSNLTFTGANQIEKALLAVNSFVSRIYASWFYSGEIYSGEVQA